MWQKLLSAAAGRREQSREIGHKIREEASDSVTSAIEADSWVVPVIVEGGELPPGASRSVSRDALPTEHPWEHAPAFGYPILIKSHLPI